MIRIVQRWLWEMCGIYLTPTLRSIANYCRDGYLFGHILYVYDIITQEQLNQLKRTEDPVKIEENFDHIRNWVLQFNMQLDKIWDNDKDDELMKRWEMLCLFYLNLHQDNACSINSPRMIFRQKIYEPNSRFKVEKPNLECDDCFEVDPNAKKINFFKKFHDIISWKKYKNTMFLRQLKEESEFRRKRLRLICIDKEFDLPCPPPTHLIDCKKPDLQSDLDLTISTSNISCENINRREKTKDKLCYTYLMKVLMIKMMNEITNDLSNGLEDHITSRLLKQSKYEKQMCDKLLKANSVKYGVMENSKILQRQIWQEETQQNSRKELLCSNITMIRKDIYVRELSRNREMHETLESNVKKLDRKRNTKFCASILNSILDMTFRYSDYKEQHNQEPWPCIFRQWASLFVKGMPIFDLIKSIELIVTYDYFEPTGEDYMITEKLYELEIQRQNAMDEIMLTDYIHKQNNSINEFTEAMNIGKKIFSHIITTLLLSKYPIPELPSIDGIPKVDKAICISGFIDNSAIALLRYYLQENNIQVIQIEDAINYCIQSYMNEILVEQISHISPESAEIIASHENANSFHNLTKKDTRKRKCEKYNPYQGSNCTFKNSAKICTVNEETQSPNVINASDKLSRAGKLGKLAYEVLHLGEQLDSDYTILIFIEYLKSLKNITGWVLIDYPCTNSQISFLEEMFTRKPIPKELFAPEKMYLVDDIADIWQRHLNIFPKMDPNAIYRKSHLYDLETKINLSYEIYLTTFIKLKQESDTWSPIITRNHIEEFYTNNIISYAFQYKTLDISAITLLSKLICQTIDNFPYKTNFISLNQTGTKKEKPKERFVYALEQSDNPDDAIRVKGTKKKDKNAKKAKVIKIIKIDKHTQLPEVSDTILEKQIIPKIGDDNWTYLDIRLPKNLEILLITLWETVEEIFTVKFKELCFIYRTNINVQIPYCSFFHQYINHLIHKPDDRQLLLQSFQIEYNNIPLDMRDDAEVQAEWHYRLNELCLQLLEIARNKLIYVNEERKKCVEDHFLATQIYELLKIYQTFMQIELDRHVSTIQFLTDYYIAMITKAPFNQTFSKIELNGLDTKNKNDLIEFVQNYLLLNLAPSDDNNPLESVLSENYTIAKDMIANLKASAMNVNQKFQATFKAIEKKKDNASKKQAHKSKKTPEFDKDILDNSEGIIEEWTYAIDGEYSRVLTCLSNLNDNQQGELKRLLTHHINISKTINNKIIYRYNQEVKSINEMREVFSLSIEHYNDIQERMTLYEDAFYIEPCIITCDDPLPPFEPPLQEKQGDYVFTIKQLNNLIDIFMEVAPCGQIVERKFTFILQELIHRKTEEGNVKVVPNQWHILADNTLLYMSQNIFGTPQYVTWKDFIIFNLNVNAPTEKEILIAREQFRAYDPNLTETVLLYQFNNVVLWFEYFDEFTTELDRFRIREMKKLLAKLYSIKYDTINYIAMLLDFCKDEDVIIGFAKALEVYTGCYVCFNVTEGQNYKKLLLQNLNETNKSVELETLETESTSKTSCECEWDCNCITEQTSESEKINDEPYFEKIYLLPIKTFVSVISATLPYFVTIENLDHKSIIEQLHITYEELKLPDFGDEAFIYEILTSNAFKLLFEKTHKFLYQTPRSFILNPTES